MPRPKRAGPTMPSGRTRQPSKAQAEIIDFQKAREARAVVLAQPHRRQNDSVMAESPVGRFCTAVGLRKEVFEAALAYQQLVARWRGTWGAPRDAGTPGDRPSGTGDGPTTKTAARWLQQIKAVEAAVKKANAASVVQQLVIDGIQIQQHQAAAAYRGLAVLAVAMGCLMPEDKLAA